MENVISIQNLSKSFGNVKAVDDLSFRVKRGALRFSGGEWSGEKHDDLHHLRAAEERQRQRPDS